MSDVCRRCDWLQGTEGGILSPSVGYWSHFSYRWIANKGLHCLLAELVGSQSKFPVIRQSNIRASTNCSPCGVSPSPKRFNYFSALLLTLLFRSVVPWEVAAYRCPIWVNKDHQSVTESSFPPPFLLMPPLISSCSQNYCLVISIPWHPKDH